MVLGFARNAIAANLDNLADLETELDRIKAIGITGVLQGFSITNATATIIGDFLDTCAAKGFSQVFLSFVDGPLPVSGAYSWDLTKVEELIAPNQNKQALAGYIPYDEPLEQNGGVRSQQLVPLYNDLKELMPGVAVGLQFSRQLWLNEFNPRLVEYRFRPGICDFAIFSALDCRILGDGTRFFRRDDLLENHRWSRLVIQQRAPGMPMYSSFPVVGNASNYMPEPEEMREIARLMFGRRLAQYGALTGAIFQTWVGQSSLQAQNNLRGAAFQRQRDTVLEILRDTRYHY